MEASTDIVGRSVVATASAVHIVFYRAQHMCLGSLGVIEPVVRRT